jgi:hypothetical protein
LDFAALITLLKNLGSAGALLLEQDRGPADALLRSASLTQQAVARKINSRLA